DAQGRAKLVGFEDGAPPAGDRRYRAPEQDDPTLREGGRVDRRADLFALGKLVHEMLGGAATTQAVRPISRVRRDVPEAWDDFVFRCVEERPAERFRDALTALAALNDLPLRPCFAGLIHDGPPPERLEDLLH